MADSISEPSTKNKGGSAVGKNGIKEGKEVFDCKDCDKVYKNKGNLVKHMRLHTDDQEKPVQKDNHRKCKKNGAGLKEFKEHFVSSTRSGIKLALKKQKNCETKGKVRKKRQKTVVEHPSEGQRGVVDVSDPDFDAEIVKMGRKYLDKKKRKLKVVERLSEGGGDDDDDDVNDPDFDAEIVKTGSKHLVKKEKKLKCKVCGEVFSDAESMDIHMHTHSGEKPFSCSLCSKSFARQAHLRTHIRRHSIPNKFPCDICHESFKREDHLRYHKINNHEGTIYLNELKVFNKSGKEKLEKTVLCEICGKGFVDQNRLKVHRKIHTENKRYQCKFCHKSFSYSSNYNVHIRLHTGKNPYKCVVCGECFRTSSRLKTHTRKHTGEYPFVCEVCGKLCGEKHLLKMHMQTHSDQKLHECSHCGKSFAHSSTLRAHIRLHTGSKPYVCQVCGHKFAQLSSLNYHKRTHTGEKPFTCHICGNSYTRKTTLTSHLLRHSGTKLVTCELCDFRCYTTRQLKKHKAAHQNSLMGEKQIIDKIGQSATGTNDSKPDQVLRQSEKVILNSNIPTSSLPSSSSYFTTIAPARDEMHFDGQNIITENSFSKELMEGSKMKDNSEIEPVYYDLTHGYLRPSVIQQPVKQITEEQQTNLVVGNYTTLIPSPQEQITTTTTTASELKPPPSSSLTPSTYLTNPMQSFTFLSNVSEAGFTYPQNALVSSSDAAFSNESESIPASSPLCPQSAGASFPVLNTQDSAAFSYEQTHNMSNAQKNSLNTTVVQLPNEAKTRSNIWLTIGTSSKYVPEDNDASVHSSSNNLSEGNDHSVGLLSKNLPERIEPSLDICPKNLFERSELSVGISSRNLSEKSEPSTTSSVKGALTNCLLDSQGEHKDTSRQTDSLTHHPILSASVGETDTYSPVSRGIPAMDMSSREGMNRIIVTVKNTNEDSLFSQVKTADKRDVSKNLKDTNTIEESVEPNSVLVGSKCDGAEEFMESIEEDASFQPAEVDSSSIIMESRFRVDKKTDASAKKSTTSNTNKKERAATVKRRKQINPCKSLRVKLKRPMTRSRSKMQATADRAFEKQSLKKTSKVKVSKKSIQVLVKASKRKEEKEKRVYTCDSCDDVFYRAGHLTLHKRTVHKNKKKYYKCSECGSEFSRLDQLTKHTRTHQKPRQLTCLYCLQTHSKDTFTRHMESEHPAQFPFSCNVCEFSCIDVLDLKKHIKLLHYDIDYKCHICNEAFSRSKFLKDHMHERHEGSNAFTCQPCNKSFAECSLLVLHNKHKHSGMKPYRCNLCSKLFVAAAKLQNHLRSHTGDKPFTCEYCGKVFAHLSLLSIHVKAHSSEKPFVCGQCNQGFTHKSTLTAHIRTHTGAKPFECDLCGKGFAQLSSLNYHRKSHDGLKPFTCELCGKSFTRSTTLKTHLMQHAGKKRFSCELCDFKCNRKHALRKHHSKKHSADSNSEEKVDKSSSAAPPSSTSTTGVNLIKNPDPIDYEQRQEEDNLYNRHSNVQQYRELHPVTSSSLAPYLHLSVAGSPLEIPHPQLQQNNLPQLIEPPKQSSVKSVPDPKDIFSPQVPAFFYPNHSNHPSHHQQHQQLHSHSVHVATPSPPPTLPLAPLPPTLPLAPPPPPSSTLTMLAPSTATMQPFQITLQTLQPYHQPG